MPPKNTNRGVVPPFGFQFSLAERPAPPTPDRPAPSDPVELPRKDPIPSRKLRSAPLVSPFSGYLKHGADGLVEPFNRLVKAPEIETEPISMTPETMHGADGYQAILQCDLQDGSRNFYGCLKDSPVQFWPEVCGTAPGAALALRSGSGLGAAKYMVDFELAEFKEVSAEFFVRARASAGRKADLDKAMSSCGEKHRFEWGYFRFELQRSDKHLKRGVADFSSFYDTRVNWTPSQNEADEPHKNFEPFVPHLPELSPNLLGALSDIHSAQNITIWMSVKLDDYPKVARCYAFENVIMNVARSGRKVNGRAIYRQDWWFSRHPAYVTVEESENATTAGGVAYRFDQFIQDDKIVLDATGKRQYPERPPWLQRTPRVGETLSTTYQPVWAKKTRYAGPHTYGSVFGSALFWEMEATAVKYSQQFNAENTYVAEFDHFWGGEVLVKIRLSGPGVDTRHEQPQVKPEGGSPIKVVLAGADMADARYFFSGVVAERHMLGFDVVFRSICPPAYEDEFPSGVCSVVLDVEYKNLQDITNIKAVSEVASIAKNLRHHQPTLDARGRAGFEPGNFVGGRLVTQLSRDFYQDWVDAHKSDDGFAVIDKCIKDMFAGLNLEQKQAYLFALRGARGAMLGIEGFPGTGKSSTLQAISIAMLLMGYTVFISAQSNNGVDAVFEKVAQWAAKYQPKWIRDGVLLRWGASSVSRKLFKDLMDNFPEDGVFHEFTSQISAANIPHSSAYKMAKYARENRRDSNVTAYLEWVSADLDKFASFKAGATRAPRKMAKKKAQAVWDMHNVCIGEPRLIGATASAVKISEVMSRVRASYDMLIFDEASQATQASFDSAVSAASFNEGIGLVILGGDHQQLPPVIKSMKENPFGNVLEISPLERLYMAYHDRPVVNLIRNYRSHPSIVELGSKVTYLGKMISGFPDGFPTSDFQSDFRDCLPRIRGGKFAQQGRHAWFVNVPGYSTPAVGGNSSWNREGVEYVVTLAIKITNQIHPCDLQHVKIINVYSYEIGKIRERLAQDDLSDIDVQTVDSFQGKEAKIVIIHCSAAWDTRFNPIGFLTDYRRLNVAITRAQNFMFVVGNLSFWKLKKSQRAMEKIDSSRGIRKLIEMVDRLGLVVNDSLP